MSVKDAQPKIRRDLPMDPDDTQLAKFKEAAREVRTDDSEERFDRVLKKVAKAPAADVRAKKQ